MKTNRQPYDLIGDIHGYADVLETLLDKLGYAPCGSAWRHPEGRRVIFLGDYIDRGPKIRKTLQIVRGMVEAGDALAIMGNHEFNALAYQTPDGRGGWCRAHSEEKTHQHEATLSQIVHPAPEEWLGWLDWFRTLPLFLELPGLRAVHASWDNAAAELARGLGGLDESLVIGMVQKGSDLHRMKELLLNGREIELPEGFYFSDKSGFKRDKIRVRWWLDLKGATYRQAVFPDSETVPHLAIPEELIADHKPYPAEERPVFVGHYWMPPETPKAPVARNVVCLDYSVAKGGPMVAYRWDGESEISAEKFVTTK